MMEDLQDFRRLKEESKTLEVQVQELDDELSASQTTLVERQQQAKPDILA